MMNERDSINSEIEKYKVSIKRIKNVIPLVTFTVLAFIFFFRNTDSLFITIGAIIAMAMYVGSFVLAYYQSLRKIKQLEEKLKSL